MKTPYTIRGTVHQIAIFDVPPNGGVIGEAGAMVYMDPGIEFKTSADDGRDANFFSRGFSALNDGALR